MKTAWLESGISARSETEPSYTVWLSASDYSLASMFLRYLILTLMVVLCHTMSYWRIARQLNMLQFWILSGCLTAAKASKFERLGAHTCPI